MKSSTFQYILLVIFGFLGVFGVLVFAGIIPIGGEGATYEGAVTLWGSVPERDMDLVLSDFNKENEDLFTLNYVYKDKQTFENDLINALAKGEGPDLVMITNDLIIKQGDKLLTIPFETYPERTFKDTFVEAGEIFLTKDGTLALPLYADPMIMYWNRDLFTNAGLVTYPKTWTDFLNISEKLTKKDNKGNVFQSAVAMGSYKNISNAKDILTTLFLQVGDNIISKNTGVGDTLSKLYNSTLGGTSRGAGSAIDFFVEFSNPAKSAYSWNPSLSNSKSLFSEGKLAVYFGKASEYYGIKANNPHLNFDVALMPQREDSSLKVTSADVIGIAVVKASEKQGTALRALYSLTGNNYGKIISGLLPLPSLRRDVLATAEKDPVLSVFNSSAIISRTWYDPDASASDIIFRSLVEAVNSGRQSASEAIRDAQIKFLEYVK
ncbi:MAG TPA: extracellular solute-binding protein [Candidatus Paceibacterota bacterium]|nr:extracellular solute-binding protein [Candidatus Paceibacterota bacterium]